MKRVGYLLVLGGSGMTAALLACVLADPPPIDQNPPPSRPLIIGDMVSPPTYKPIVPTTSQLTSLTFTVGVLADPNVPLEHRVVEDFDPSANTGILLPPVGDGGVELVSDPDAGEAIQVLTTTVQPVDPAHCHTFTFVVAADFSAQVPAFVMGDLATPSYPPGGDLVTWFYEPLTDCSFYDAAPPTFVPDGGADASDGTGE